MANLNPVVRNGRSVLIGASAMQFTDQMAVDIYFEDYWNAEGRLKRVAVVCVGWGMGIAAVQEADQRTGPWSFNDLLLPEIAVHDYGIHPFAPPGPLPNVPPGQPLAPTGIYNVNGHMVQGHHIPWHNRVELRRAPPGNEPLHYNQHLPRKHHRVEPPAIKPDGSHRVFSTITYATQIQNFRRIREIAQED